ncbi:hypothetical protein OS493_039225, partial [Desmophyllum pertusum]
MTTINCEQLAAILDEKLEQKLAPLNSIIAEMKKTVEAAMNHVKFVNAKYDEMEKMTKSANDERKALRDENKILKSTIHSMESSLDLVTRANHDLEQYTRRECVEIRGIPVAATP